MDVGEVIRDVNITSSTIDARLPQAQVLPCLLNLMFAPFSELINSFVLFHFNFMQNSNC